MRPVLFIANFALLFLATVVFLPSTWANGPDDFGPTPEESLQALGIDTSAHSLRVIASDPGINSEVRYFASVALGRTKDPEHLSVLEPLLADINKDVRIGALIAIRTIASPSSVDRLIQTMDNDKSVVVRRVSITALGEIGSDAAIDAILRVSADTTNPIQLRTDSITAVEHLLNLKRVQYVVVQDRLKPMLDDADPSVRLAAALTASAGGDAEAAVPVLVEIATNTAVDNWLVAKAITSIQATTKNDFSYVSDGSMRSRFSKEGQQPAISALKAWWAENNESYGGSSRAQE